MVFPLRGLRPGAGTAPGGVPAGVPGSTRVRLAAAACTVFLSAPAPAEVDAGAAQALAKRNDCFKCHAIDKTKKAPPYTRIAGKLRSKPDAVRIVVEHITTGPRVQLEDGSYEDHRIVDTRDLRELENLARWLLSL